MELGTVSKVNCKAQGSSPPVITWMKEGQALSELPPHVSVNNGTLVINGVKSSDKGRYTCVASNTQGSINATITIEVHSRFQYLMFSFSFIGFLHIWFIYGL